MKITADHHSAMTTIRSLPALCLFATGLALAATSAPAGEAGFTPIFNGRTLDGWVGLGGDTSSYYVQDGQLICKGDGRKFIFSEEQYANFILRFEFKLDPGGNNGIGIRAPMSRRPHVEGMEIQIIDDPYYVRGIPKPDKKPADWTKVEAYQRHGSIYGVVAAKPGHLKPAGQWNQQEIVCDGRRVKVTLNGVVIVDAHLDQVKPVDGLEHPGLKNERGHLVLCAHGDYNSQVYFRNMRLKELR